MKTLTAKVTAAIAGPVISPAYLVEIGFSIALRSCTRGTVEWNGITWPAAGIRVGDIRVGQGAAKSVSLSMANVQFAISQIVLAESATGKRVRVWKLFGEAPYALEDAHLVFDGFIDSVPTMMETVDFNCTTGNVRALSIPNITLGLPFFNHLPRPGEVILWGGEQYELQPR